MKRTTMVRITDTLSLGKKASTQSMKTGMKRNSTNRKEANTRINMFKVKGIISQPTIRTKNRKQGKRGQEEDSREREIKVKKMNKEVILMIR